MEELVKIEHDLIGLRELLDSQNGYKYWALGFFAILDFAIFFWAVVPLINYLTNNLRAAEVLKKALDNSNFIPKDFSIMDTMKPVFITAWAINDRTPRFFSQFSFKNWRDEKFNHEMTLNNMVLASAATPYYFKPVMIEGHKSPFISGDNVAQSPAMYAMLNAIQNDKVPKEDIRIISVGAINQKSSSISKNTGLIDWAVRLASLNAPVKRHTMDYFANEVLRSNGNMFEKFEIQMNLLGVENLYYTSDRVKALLPLAQDQIWQNAYNINFLLNELVTEKFGPYHTCDTKVECTKDNTFTGSDASCDGKSEGDSCYKDLGKCNASSECVADAATSS
jgi:hypothetical protein